MSLTRQILAVLAVLFCAVPAMAQWDDGRQPARDSLKGLRGIVVQVNVSSLDALPDDPTERELQKAMEERLANAGITIYKRPWGASESYDDYPTLIVSVSFMNFNIFYYHLRIDVTLRQQVRLATNPSLKLQSPTWEWGGGGIEGGFSKRDEVAEVIDHFICDLRTANPSIKGPMPDCAHELHVTSDRDSPQKKQPKVMTELEDQLIHAAGLNEIKEVKALLAKGASVNAHDHADATPLTYAVRSGNRRVGDTAVVDVLLEQGANPNVSVSCRLTPLMSAVERGDLKIVQALLNHGAEVNAATPEGYTALMAASALGSPDVVELLLKKGASFRAKTRDGQTALTLAAANRNRTTPHVRDLINPPYTSISEAELLKMSQNEHDQVIQLLKNAAGRTP